MKIQNLAAGVDIGFHNITAESGDRIIVDTPSGAVLTIAVDSGIIIFQRTKGAREGSVAIIAPLLEGDADKVIAVSYEEQTVEVNPMENEDDND
ncbi:hypothetical protein [Burkholderia ubonensis]|uniref:hypothetical protein n=1 Tax=Burkholderia ubonensis TaxID=101571 RepID=UPI00075BCB81|nr:hypothetical protein [Burkholderia ubonensis]KVZ72509.1 hypothetical protein WL22_11475 [Burkholderia ubonensis]KWE24857.1 hypothetical protein WL75_00030 [Burkholderia ubonensis]